MTKIIRVFIVLCLALMNLQQNARASAFGIGNAKCRDYLAASPKDVSALMMWFQGYLNANEDMCMIYKYGSEHAHSPNFAVPKSACLTEKIYFIPNIGPTLDGRTGYMNDLQTRLSQACYNNPEQDFHSASQKVIDSLNMEFHLDLPF